ncbi:SGNH/GDSL hydrolase family protein [Cytophagaceae bacterium YF14B1]|uniref:SGNH/GDSL hydrolase family protein n=2 Tax=Xanthocytophaga flava TaxID=3048013 RepID=A0AAE3QL43_9BACT|nr:SGNH/GDSL hydrolase family protein [Xanthocytophaga flavus]
MQQPSSSTELSFLSLGDSYTIGESVAENERWSVQLAEMLRQKGIPVNNPDIIAQTGWTTEELANAITKSGNTKTYDLVSLLIGVNNQYRGQSTERYRKELQELLKTSVRFAKGNPKHVFVLSIPDWGVTPAGESRDRQQVAKEIDSFNAVCQEECKKAGIVFFDITPLSRTAATDKNLIASDQLHFSGKMYQQWATHVLEGVTKLLK